MQQDKRKQEVMKKIRRKTCCMGHSKVKLRSYRSILAAARVCCSAKGLVDSREAGSSSSDLCV